MPNELIYGIIAIIVVIIVYIVVKLLLNNSNNSHTQDEEALELFHKELKRITLPKVIEDIPHKDIRSHAEELLKTYKALDYNQKTRKDLEDIEWNSWEVSIVIKMYKEDFALNAPTYKKIFPKDMIDNSIYNLEMKLHPIFKNYAKEVTLTGSKKYLRDQRIWSNYDMSVLLLFLCRYQSHYEGDS